ncbi:MAG: hypothetical protein CO098_18060 [Bacteroidetes bacterium CG_4_9_14_3_um_filter_41_19]|nr:MAG: hypothetical protein CO098_18060 [Bacteroidetes bacterium CG_4_9_14_3_um_filter_41_19]
MQGPIVIGGIGGSGTRVLASILKVFNVYIGDDLNRPLDNLTYTFLFKRPLWYNRNHLNADKIRTGIRIIEKSMLNNHFYSISELTFLINATISMAKSGHNTQKKGTGSWAFHRLFHILLERQKDIQSYSGWGWKEPNSHLILENLHEHFNGFKYIHTIRHGLDMAYSDNQQQLYNWGKMFGVGLPEIKEEIPFASFRYWVKVNRRIIELRKKIGSDKIYLINFDEFCLNPEPEIRKIINFIGIEVGENQLEKAIGIPSIPDSKDRYKEHDLTIYREDDLQFLHSLGYSSL